MINDYECPRCHNIFPSINKLMHDTRCTEEKPLPLNASRIQIIQQNENKNEIENKNVFENKNEFIPMKEEEENNNNNYNNNNNNEGIEEPKLEDFPEIFVCDICKEVLNLNEKDDHMYCHNLEKEENNKFRITQKEIDEQKKIEEQIRKNRNRINRPNTNANNRDNNNLNRNRDNRINLNDLNHIVRNNNNRSNQNNNIMRQIRINARENNNNNLNNRAPNIIRNNNRIPNPIINIGQIFQNFDSLNNNPIPRNISNHNFMIPGNVRHLFEINNMPHQEFSFIPNHGNRHHRVTNEILNQLPETKIEDVNKLDPEKRNCVICLEDFKNGDKAINLPCIHLFHKDCIKSWLKKNNCCPICKYKIDQNNLNSAYN